VPEKESRRERSRRKKRTEEEEISRGRTEMNIEKKHRSEQGKSTDETGEAQGRRGTQRNQRNF